MGGDEFCVLASLLERATTSDRAAAAHALAEHGEGFDVDAPLGSVAAARRGRHATAALREADRRMYARKSLESRSSAGRQSADVLLRVLSERNPDLGVHLDEVPSLPRRSPRGSACADEELAPLLQAAALHDVGKVAIPDAILNKPGPLDEDEWAFMRRHTIIGERILAAAPALARGRAARPLEPRALRRQRLPRRAGRRGHPARRRGSSRSATPSTRWSPIARTGAPLTPVQALAELRRCAGTQFDPEVVDVFGVVLAERERRLSGLPERELA